MMGEIGRSVRLGIIGLGGRGCGQMSTLLSMPDVEVAMVCDRYADRIEKAQKIVSDARSHTADGTQDYRKVLARTDIDAVVIMTSWTTHLQIAIAALKAGKRVAMEVGGASSLEECWALVHASEDTGVPCMLLENCCYGREEMAVLRMVKEGLFGELVHCQGGYEHDLRDEIGNGDINRHYRQENFQHRNGELYPTHELGPISKLLTINRGNRMVSLVSMSSKAVGEHAWLMEHRADHALAQTPFMQGDIVTTMIKCAHGETILLTHDCTLPRPYSRGGRVQGTKGIWMEDNKSIFIEGMSPVDPTAWTHEWEAFDPYLERYDHPLWKEYAAFGLRGGHGGMDYLVLRAFVESVQNQTPPPIDVYDTAAWMAITCLSESSIAMGSLPVAVPDFTDGRWIGREPATPGAYALDAVYPAYFTEK